MINKTKTESCKTELCQYDSATRTRFYDGMLLTAEHLRQEQSYHREALRRVVRNIFGSGIVCGLGVKINQAGLCVTIEPGVAIDCCGNVIEVCKCITVDLSKECKDSFGDCYSQTQPPQPFPKFLVLRYKEIDADPEPVLAPQSECEPAGEGAKCQHSSTREGYCLELWDKCPCAAPVPQVGKDLSEELKASGQRYPQVTLTQTTGSQAANLPGEPTDCLNLPLPCSPCDCCEAAVGLATLKFDCVEKKFVPNTDEQCDCRRHVLSPGLLSWILSYIDKDQSNEAAALYRRVDPETANLIGVALEFNRRGDEFKNLYNEIKKRDADVAYLRDVRFKQVDDEMKQVDSGLKNLRDVEMKKIVDAEVKNREDEIKKRDVEIKKREDEIKKLSVEVKKLTDDLSKQRKKYPI